MDKGVAIVNPTGGTTPLNYSLNTEGYLEDQTPFLAVGAHSFQAKYNGDPSYSASALSTAVAFTVTPAPTITVVTPSTNTVAANTNFTLTAFVDTQSATNPSGGSSGLPPSGTVTFLNGATMLGTTNVSATTDVNDFVAAQATLTTHLAATGSITAVYNADGNYTTSTSPAVTVTVTGGVTPSINPTSATNPINISAPGQMGTSVITVSGTNITAADPVTLTCAITPSNLSDPPTCSFNTNPIALSNTVASGTSTLTVSTTAVTALVAPKNHPHDPNWLLMGEVGAFIACLFLLGIAPQKRRGMLTFAMVLFAAMAVATGCGSGGGINGGGGGGNPGTTVGPYTVTVTTTPQSGATQTTTITVNVQ